MFHGGFSDTSTLYKRARNASVDLHKTRLLRRSKMRSIVAVLMILACCEARPNPELVASAALAQGSHIIGGTDAEPGEFPWQLSQQRLGSTWSHSCGASLLKANYALSAAHCVEGTPSSAIRVLAGLHDRSQPDDAVISNCLSYRMHESYNTGPGTYPNDIAIITLVTPIEENGANIQYALLPDDDSDQFVGRTLVISGWGRTSASTVLPNVLQKATMGVISTAECNERVSTVSGASVTDGMICLFDAATSSGSCNADSGGPANIYYPDESSGRRVVAGVTSWVVRSLGICLPSYPSVYTRTSAYLDWIDSHTP